MRRIEPTHGVLAQTEQLSVGKRAGRPISKVTHRYYGSNRAAQWYGLRSDGKPFVERAALVGFHVGESDVAKALDWQNAPDRFTHQGKHPSRTGVEKQWHVIRDEVLIEREPACAFDRNWRVDAIDRVSHLMHIRPGLPVRDNHQTLAGRGAPVVGAPARERSAP